MRCYAIIPARAGSKGLSHKNIRPLNGHPLLAYSIAFARKIPRIERIIVSTDSPEYREIAIAYGGECPGLRPAEASHDTAMDEDILAHLHVALPAHGIALPDVWVRLKPTSPFRRVRSVVDAMEILERDPSVESVRIISEAENRIHTIDADGWLQPAVPGWDPARSIMRRTEFPRAFKPFNLDVFRHHKWVQLGSGYMGRRVAPIVDHKVTGLDIDGEDDFELADLIVSAQPRPAYLAPYIHDPV